MGWEEVRVAPGITRVTPLDFVSYPITHSLLAAVAWSLVLGLAFSVVRRSRAGAAVIGLAALSHWLLDFATHRPDLPLFPGGKTYVGLGLWGSLPATMVVELLLFAFGLTLYLQKTRARDRIGVWGFWSLIGLLLLTYLENLLGPPPPSAEAIASVGQAQWLLVLWAY